MDNSSGYTETPEIRAAHSKLNAVLEILIANCKDTVQSLEPFIVR